MSISPYFYFFLPLPFPFGALKAVEYRWMISEKVLNSYGSILVKLILNILLHVVNLHSGQLININLYIR